MKYNLRPNFVLLNLSAFYICILQVQLRFHSLRFFFLSRRFGVVVVVVLEIKKFNVYF